MSNAQSLTSKQKQIVFGIPLLLAIFLSFSLFSLSASSYREALKLISLFITNQMHPWISWACLLFSIFILYRYMLFKALLHNAFKSTKDVIQDVIKGNIEDNIFNHISLKDADKNYRSLKPLFNQIRCLSFFYYGLFLVIGPLSIMGAAFEEFSSHCVNFYFIISLVLVLFISLDMSGHLNIEEFDEYQGMVHFKHVILDACKNYCKRDPASHETYYWIKEPIKKQPREFLVKLNQDFSELKEEEYLEIPVYYRLKRFLASSSPDK